MNEEKWRIQYYYEVNSREFTQERVKDHGTRLEAWKVASKTRAKLEKAGKLVKERRGRR